MSFSKLEYYSSKGHRTKQQNKIRKLTILKIQIKKEKLPVRFGLVFVFCRLHHTQLNFLTI